MNNKHLFVSVLIKCSGLIIQYSAIFAIFLYPLLVFFGLRYFDSVMIAPLLCFLFVIRLCFMKMRINKTHLTNPFVKLGKTVVAIGLSLCICSWFFKETALLMYYPVFVNGIFLGAFAYSLTQSQSIIEQIARLTTKDFPQSAISYTKKVTQVWCVFFVINGLLSFITCLIGNVFLWSLYNGAVSYILMGLLMGIEWLIRRRVMMKLSSVQ